jgi:hypothetical protein
VKLPFKQIEGYSNVTPTPTQVGGINAGETFDDASISAMFDKLLYPFQSPTFSSFSFSGQTSPLEVGDSIPSNIVFNWTTTNPANIVPNSLLIEDVTGSSVLGSSLPDTGSFNSTVGQITKTSQTSNQFKITLTPTQGTNVTRTTSVDWYWKVYHGESVTTPLIDTDVKALRVSTLRSGFSGTYSFNAGGYKYICYPSLMGTASVFKDSSTNLDIPMNTMYVVSITNDFSITTNYNIHRTSNIMGSALSIVVS